MDHNSLNYHGRSLEVIKLYVVRYVTHDFLLVFHGNTSILLCFRDIANYWPEIADFA